MARAPKKLPPLHPGEVLREEFMAPLGLSAYQVGKKCGIPRTRIERVCKEKMGITPDTALRLGRLFNTTAEFWTNLQTAFEIETVSRKIGPQLARIRPVIDDGANLSA